MTDLPPDAHRSHPAALLLTGGASRRMGRDKAILLIRGVGLAERTAALLVRVAAPVVEVGPRYTLLPHVQEAPPGGGPLCAVAAGWAALKRLGCSDSFNVVVVATDLPRLTPGMLDLLSGYPGQLGVVPLDPGGRSQPLCARYPMPALEMAASLVSAGERSLKALLAGLDLRWIPPSVWQPAAGDPDALRDVDTPADLAALT